MANLHVGGAEKVSISLLKNLDLSIFDPMLLIVGSRGGDLLNSIPANINITFCNKRKARAAIFDIVKVVWGFRPHLMFVNMSYLNLMCAMFRWAMPQSLVILARETSIISSNISQYRPKFLWDWLYKLFYRRLDHIVCQSSLLQNDLLKNFNVARTKTSIIHNPVDIKLIRRKAIEGLRTPLLKHVVKKTNKSAFNNDPNIINIVAVGNFRPEKNFDGLVRAMDLVTKNNVHLHIIGGGPEEKEILNSVKKLKLEKRITFYGFLVNPYQLMANSDALVLPSHYEGMPNVLLEALALKTPVIATPAGGVCEYLLKNISGCVLATNSSDASIALAIDRWVDIQPRGINKDAVGAFDQPIIQKQFEDLFKKLVK